MRRNNKRRHSFLEQTVNCVRDINQNEDILDAKKTFDVECEPFLILGYNPSSTFDKNKKDNKRNESKYIYLFIFHIDLNSFMNEGVNKNNKTGNLIKKFKRKQKNKFLNWNIIGKEKQIFQGVNIFKQYNSKNNKYMEKKPRLSSFTYNNNSEKNCFDNILTNIETKNNKKEEEKISNSKINELESEINKLRTMKTNFLLYFNLLKNYSYNLSSIFSNIAEEKDLISPKHSKTNMSKTENGKLIDNISTNSSNKNTNFFTQFKIWMNELILKYEKKIEIIQREYEEMTITLNKLSNENCALKEELEKEKEAKVNILKQLKKIKDDNNNLIKQNKFLDNKCTKYFNITTKSKYEQKNFEDEIEYKNKIIKYLENIIKADKNNEMRRSYNKILDLKKNIHGIIKEKKFTFDNLLDKPNKIRCISFNQKKETENNDYSFLNDKNISSISNRTKKDAKVKKEINVLDNEIEEIQKKLDNFISTQNE